MTDVAAQDLASVDLSDADHFVERVPYDLFARMRAEAPVRWNPMPDEPGFWSVTKAEDVERVTRDHTTFSSARGISIRTGVYMPAETMEMMILNMDPPRHTSFRRIVQYAFTSRRVQNLDTFIRDLVVERIDAAAASGRFDLVHSISEPVPLIVIAKMLGCAEADYPKLLDWTNRVTGIEDHRVPDIDAFTSLMEFTQYLVGLVEERRESPREDLVSALIAAEVDGQSLAMDELVAFFALLMLAGNDTTRNTYSLGMQALLEQRDQFETLIRAPEIIPTAVEEILRWATPVMHFRRTATTDTELRGVKISEGDKVVIWYPSANRDEEFVENPNQFDLTRPVVKHHTFGAGGRHFCLGAELARLELRILFEETVRRMPGLTMDGDPVRLRSSIFNGLLELPVALAR